MQELAAALNNMLHTWYAWYTEKRSQVTVVSVAISYLMGSQCNHSNASSDVPPKYMI